MTEATMTEQAANTTESQATSTQAATEAVTATVATGQQQTEGQTTEATTATEVKTEDDTGKPKGAPEKYEFKAEEGRTFDPKVLEAFSEVSKELNLSQDDAQKVIDKIAPTLAARQAEALSEARTQWIAEVKNDQEIGGTAVAEKIALANKTFESFGTPELRTLLENTGLGDHPEMIRWAHRVGKAISEDGFVSGKGGAQPDQKDARKLYSASNMNP